LAGPPRPAPRPPPADAPPPQPLPPVRRKRHRPVAGEDDSRRSRRNAPGWRKVNLGLLVLLIGLIAPFAVLMFAYIGVPGAHIIMLALHFVPVAGYLLLTFVHSGGGVRRGGVRVCLV